MEYPKSPNQHISLRLKLFFAVLISLILFCLFYRLNDYPTLWWDEGWTLSAARNWIEHSHLGNYRDGQPVPPGIPLRFPVAVSVTVSMLVFGIGIWQGRLPGIIYTIFALVFYVYIISQLYNRRTGLATLFIIIILSPISFQPILMGRQVMAEMPMMFYLLGGYILVWLALTRAAVWTVGASIFFGIAIHTKLQVPPFWLASIILATLVAIKYRDMRAIKIFSAITLGSIGAAFLLYLLQNSIMPGSFDDPELVRLLLNTSVFTPEWSIRWKALYTVALFTMPQVLGFIWVGKSILSDLLSPRGKNVNVANSEWIEKKILIAAIWGLGTSWLIWYSLMSMYWIRYVFPAYFIGCIFVAVYIGKLTNNFDIKKTIRQSYELLLRWKFNNENIRSTAILLAFGVALGLTIGTLRIGFTPNKWSPNAMATYLHNNIPANARVETYESELFFLAPELTYLFPPDSVSMQLYRRADLNVKKPIDYDPLKGNPDYLIIGPYAQTYGVYDELLIKEWFELRSEIGGYQVYRARTSTLTR